MQVVRNKKAHLLTVTEGMFHSCVFVLCNIYWNHFSGMKRSKYVLVVTRGVDHFENYTHSLLSFDEKVVGKLRCGSLEVIQCATNLMAVNPHQIGTRTW
jgi:hypothetical protein